MNTLKMESTNITQKNIDKIGTLFPNVITEMIDEDKSTPQKIVYKKGINFELLKQELSNEVVDGEECYDFTWVGKKSAIVEGNTPIRKTLRPCIKESKNWENTENLFIEGDNLEALKLLQESYLNSIKMIYIDPPYNTGNDFIYKDDYTINNDEYNELIGLYDDDENRLFQNIKSNGRFHSDWCSMLYPRLKLAYNLLTDDGVIFISIDDKEQKNLKAICDEIFGEENFVAQLVWQNKTGAGAKSKGYIGLHEYILCYTKKFSSNWDISAPLSDKMKAMYNKKDKYYDKLGPFATWPLNTTSMGDRPNLCYPIIHEGIEIWPKKQWLWSRARVEKAQSEGKLVLNFNKKTQKWSVRFKGYLNDINGKIKSGKPTTIFIGPYTQEGTKDFSEFFDRSVFDFPKPVHLISEILSITINGTKSDDIVLDFFSGSSTTAHSVMQLNAEDGGNRKFIMVQLPELCNEDSEAFKEGYTNICEIGKERIRRAGDKINDEITKNNEKLKITEKIKPLIDIGFRVLKVDSTNMKDVYYAANEYSQSMLAGLESNIKEDRTDLDLLYGVMLDWGLPLSLSHKIEKINGVNVHTVDNGSLVACFEEKVSENLVRKIASRKPLRVVFRDSSFTNSPDKINVEEIFKLLTPNTTVKVI